jgi:ABC-type transport system involved in multi-copper enzyme maturation permease subunit
MLKTVLKRELLHNLYSLRFLISLALLIGVFIAGSLSFVKGQALALDKYRETQAQFLESMKNDAAGNATELAVSRRTYGLRPRDNAFIADAKEKYLPNAVVFSAWNVFSFQNKSGSANPFLKKFDELNWSFIVAVIVSFVALMFTFDAVSGEKETKTLALALSNPVSRGTLLIGKFLSAAFSVMAIVLAGALVSLLIVLLLGRVGLTPTLTGEVIGFLAVAGLLAAAFAALGLFSSVVSPNSNVSLLLALSFWLAVVVIIPNSSTFVAKNLYAIESSEAVQKKVDAAFADLNKSAPPGSWMSRSDNPFLPQHRLRADLQMKRLQAEKGIRDDYYQEMFHQFERTRLLTAASPVSLFEYMTEAVVGGGYVRFRKAWNDMHVYQGQFLDFFKALDAVDKDSPHWFNPNEDVSTTRKPVAFEKVPQFQEQPMSFAERLLPVLKYLVIAVFSTAAVFLATFFLFVRYDVR